MGYYPQLLPGLQLTHFKLQWFFKISCWKSVFIGKGISWLFALVRGFSAKSLINRQTATISSGRKAKLNVIVLDSSLVFQKVVCHCPNTDIFFQCKGWPRCHQRPISQWRVQLQPKWDIIPSCSLWFAAIHVLNSNDSWEFLVHDYYDEKMMIII